jgi:hypothetical protein
MKLRRISPLLATVLSIASLFGCSSTASGPGAGGESIVRQPEVLEKQLFESMRDYYCERKQWPESLDDVEAFEVARGADEKLFAEFRNPRFTSQRAIILTMNYENALGAERKVSFITPPQCDDGDSEERVSIAAGRIRFGLPSGFRLMGGADVKARWKNPPYPDAVWIGDSDILIAIRFGDVEVSEADLVGLSAELTEAYERSVPGLGWLKKEAIAVKGRTLLEHEFDSDSSRGRIVSYVISASFDRRLVAITVIGPAAQLAQVDEIARSVEQTLSIR